MEVVDYGGYDEALAHLCLACAEMLAARTPGKASRVADLPRLFASYVVEKDIAAAAEEVDFRGGLPMWQLRKVEDLRRADVAAPSARAVGAARRASTYRRRACCRRTRSRVMSRRRRVRNSSSLGNAAAVPTETSRQMHLIASECTSFRRFTAARGLR